jgi:hypothetical protein
MGPGDAESGWAVCQPAGQAIGASGCHRALLPADPISSIDGRFEDRALGSFHGDSGDKG